MTWKIEEYENNISTRSIRIIDSDGQTVADDGPYYPTAITAEHAATIVAAVNEIAELREQLSSARALIADYERVPL